MHMTGMELTLGGCILAFLSLFGIYVGIRHDFIFKLYPVRKEPDTLEVINELARKDRADP